MLKCIYMHMYTHLFTYIDMHVYTVYVFLVSLYPCTYVCVCMYCMHACMLVYLSCMRVNVCLHACIHRWQKGWGHGTTAPPNFKGAL